ncbi:hypothetical protein BY996DRAFT_6875799 [Phakopsora pachyrhizi]|nr:hypothetical protein BY996DRAFT_6875799 [Phakopsora pachyrhizi]
MFPQLTENEVRYALVVTRGGVEAVAERVLIRGGLDPPPPNFFPPTPTPPSTTQTQSNLTAPNISTTLLPNVIKPNHSMISKLCLEPYKLEQDLAFRENRDWKWEDCLPEMAKSYLTSSTTENSSLKERKAKMVLESRWRVLQNDKKGKTVI